MTKLIGYGGGGGKGGGGGRSPVESPDSLHSTAYAKVLDLVSEGEIVGLVDGLNSIYLNETPVQHGGVTNFQGIAVHWRLGTQHQEFLPAFPAVENEIAVAVELRYDNPWTRDLTNLEMTSVRLRLSVPSLQRTLTEDEDRLGDTEGYRVEYQIELAVDGGPFNIVLTSAFDGKTTSKYERTHTIVLPQEAQDRWSIRVRRTTTQSESSSIADTTMIEAITEVIDGKFTYPNSAYFGIEVDSSYFNSIPRRSFHIRGRIIRVPSNYDPTTRNYGGVWDGGFKLAYTNNPAWIFLDLITHQRYGLGDRIPLGLMDKWALYAIAQFCDQMVPDGLGGMEPRFTCNTQIQSRENAFELIQKLASVFQGMAYYASGIVSAVSDMPKDPVHVYTNSNVLNGKFNYSGSAQDTRYTVALVSWNDPQDFYQSKVEYVEDRDGFVRYGHVETNLTSFGCTSQGQAQRAGRWALLTSQVETQLCSFSVGLEGLRSRPGDVIAISDQHLIGDIRGGRISASTLNSITTDADTTVAPGDLIYAMLPSGTLQIRTVQSVVGRRITVTQNFSGAPQVQGQWAVEGEVKVQYYRVLSATEKEGLEFELKCVQYEPGKFDAIANGTRIDPRVTTAIPPGFIDPPTNVRLTENTYVDQGIAKTNVTVAWDPPKGAIAFEGGWRRNEGEWVPIPRTGSSSFEIRDVYSGRYIAQIKAINPLDVRSISAFSNETTINGKNTPPPVVTFLTTAPLLWGISIKWGLPAEGAQDVERSELWYSLTPNRGDATKLGDYAYPQTTFEHLGLRANQDFYYWVRLVDRSGNFGEFFPAGEGVLGSTSTQANEYLDAIRDEVMTTDLGEALTSSIEDGLEIVQLMLDAERLIREDEDIVVVSKVEEIRADIQTGVSASIENLQEVIANEKAAMTVDLQEMRSFITTDISSELTTLRQTFAAADQSLAVSQQQLTSRLGNAEASVQNTATTLSNTAGKLSAMYTMKTQVTMNGQRYVAGIGLGVENNPNGPGFISQILLQADRVALLNTNNNGVTVPFAVEGGQVFINSAVIQDASITNAKIADASITNAKIGGQIYSKNWTGPGGVGWMLDVDGNLYANSGQFGGHLQAATGTFTGTLNGANGIFSGTLRADVIDAVSTLNIAGNAVSTTLYFWGTDSVNIYTSVESRVVLLVKAHNGNNPNFGAGTSGRAILGGLTVISPTIVYSGGVGGGDGGMINWVTETLMAVGEVTIPAGNSTIEFGAKGGSTLGATVIGILMKR